MTRTSRRKFIKVTSLAGLTLPLADLGKIAGMDPLKIRTRDFAESKNRDEWLQHAVLGGPSFDTFERIPGNPIWRGEPPLEWPVNGFLFQDPVSGDFFVYVGAYTKGYISQPSRCLGLRSSDKGKTWKSIGPIIEPDASLFDKNGHTPDVSVVYEKPGATQKKGRYHMIYDWGELDFTKEGGIAYAWADKPEGPWHRLPAPVTRNTELPLMKNRYRRTYAATLIKRKNDWMITGMMDDAPRSWALFVMTAPNPEGPYSERKLVRDVREDYFHPPLMEFYPSFVHDGYLYAPATSVALNRNFGSVFRAPLEKATEPDAWELYQHGSVWHSEDKESEYDGIWGQTYSGQVDAQGKLWAMFPSRDSENRGTIHIAHRPWNKPYREKGFVLNAHQGPTLSVLRQAYGTFELKAAIHLRGNARLVWDYAGLLGPDRPASDATLGKGANQSYFALDLTEKSWSIHQYDASGARTPEGRGDLEQKNERQITLRRNEAGNIYVHLDETPVWRGSFPDHANPPKPGAIGWWLEPHTYLEVKQFAISGEETPTHLFYDATDALLGAGEATADWKIHEEGFRSLPGYSTIRKDAKAKWNVQGRRFTVWCPRGPQFGSVEVLINGIVQTKINLNTRKLTPSKPLWSSDLLPAGHYAVTLRPFRGVMAFDCLEVET